MRSEKKGYKVNEIFLIAIAATWLGFVLALRLEWPLLIFNPITFLVTFILMLLLLAFFVAAQKVTAHWLDCSTETKLLTFRRYWFERTGIFSGKLPFKFPLWLVLPSLLFFLTSGFIKWLAILDCDIKPKLLRARRKYHVIAEEEAAKIYLAAPLTVLGLALLTRTLGIITDLTIFTNFAFLAAWLGFTSLLPLGLGFKAMITARLAWAFSLAISFFILLLIKIESLLAIAAAALLLAFAMLCYYLLLERS